MFSKKPVLNICGTVIRRLEKTTAFGGVAAGIMKAAEAAIVAGIITMSGFSSALAAVAAKTGKSTAVVAVLEVSSVRKLIKKATTRMITQSEVPSRSGDSAAPISLSKPET